MKSLFLKFSYYKLVGVCPKQGWKIPTSEEVKNSDIMHDVVWVRDSPPHDEDSTRAYLYVKSKDKLELCNKSFMQHCAVIKTPCVWKYSIDGYYLTECEKAFEFSHDEPFENGEFKYCPYCGKEIEVKDN